MTHAGRVGEVGPGRSAQRIPSGLGEGEAGCGVQTEDRAQVGAARALQREAVRLGRGERLLVRQHLSRGKFFEMQAAEEAEALVLLAEIGRASGRGKGERL